MSDPTTGQDDDLGAPDRPSADGGSDTAFHTDTATANGVRQRGMGVGARELAAQRDPSRPAAAAAADEGETEEGGSGPDQTDSQTDSNGRA